VVERDADDPYGQVTYLTAAFAPTATGGSTVAWVYLHQGERLDSAAGEYDSRERVASPTMDRFLQSDPTRFGSDDTNFYRDERDNPTNATDPSGEYADEGHIIGAGLELAAKAAQKEKENADVFQPVVQLDKTTFSVPESGGIAGNITVVQDCQMNVGGKLSQSKQQIYLDFTVTKGSAKDVHWIQFAYKEAFDWNDRPIDGGYSTLVDGKKRYHEYGKKAIHVDSTSSKESFYDLSQPKVSKRTAARVAITDDPDVKPNTETTKKLVAYYESYLVVNGKVVYQVTWSKTGFALGKKAMKDGEWEYSYGKVVGKAVTSLPDYLDAKGDTLPAGYSALTDQARPDPNSKQSNPNPIPKENR
jgi:RHS repeat-associated protein